MNRFLRSWRDRLAGMGGRDKGDTSVTVESQIKLIRWVAYAEIAVGVIILHSQTVAIAASHEFATRSLTGIWTSWFFFMSAGVTLFWSSRCTFNGLLSVLVLQIISATMGIPLFTACCLLFGVYNFRWQLFDNGEGAALIGSSIAILVTNLIMMFSSLAQMGLNGYNAYNCYFLAYGGKPAEAYDYGAEAGTPSNRGGSGNQSRGNTSNQGNAAAVDDPDDWGQGDGTNNQQNDDADDWDAGDAGVTQNQNTNNGNDDWDTNADDWGNGNAPPAPSKKARAPKAPNRQTISPKKTKVIVYDDPSMPQPPPDLMLAAPDISIIKITGVTQVFFAVVIFCCQTAMLALASEPGLQIGVGIWGSLYYAATGIVTVYNGWKPTAQSAVAIFILQAVQFILSIPLVGIAYYIVAVFGSCIQFIPVAACPKSPPGAGLAITVLGSVMAISGTVQGLISLILMLICSQPVCGIRCMVSGATVYPTL